jgi:hypothetical protein
MVETFVILLVIQAAVIVLFESTGTIRGHIDFLRATSAVWLVAFALFPLYFSVPNISVHRGTRWEPIIFRYHTTPGVASMNFGK